MENISNNILRFHRVNGKKLESWLVEAIQMNEYLGLSDEEIIKVAVEIAKIWNDRKLPLTHDHFLLAVDSKLRQKYASSIETETHHRGEKTQEVVSKVKKDVSVLTFDPEEQASDKPTRNHDF